MTIEIDKDFAIEVCCKGSGSNSPRLEEVFFDAEKKHLIATDGTMMAVVPVDCSDDEKSRYLSAAEVAVMRRPSECQKDELQFPLEGVNKIISNRKQFNVSVGIDLTLLGKLASAIGAKNHVILRFSIEELNKASIEKQSYTAPMGVSSESESEAFGVLMPRRVHRVYKDSVIESFVVFHVTDE